MTKAATPKQARPAMPAVVADKLPRAEIDAFVERNRSELNASIRRSRQELGMGVQSIRSIDDVISDGRKRYGAG